MRHRLSTHEAELRVVATTDVWRGVWGMVPETDAGCFVIDGQGERRYAMVWVAPGIRVPAHRLAWTITRGSIPEGRLVLHRCDNGRCIRPSHLYLGDQYDNMRDAVTRGRLKPQHLKRRPSRCRKRHAMTPENTMPDRHRYRCRECYRANLRIRAKRRQNRRCITRGG